VINSLIKNSYSDIFNELYKITNGKIILSGSLSLKYQSIINRDVNDLDVNILVEDWDTYRNVLEKEFRIYPTSQLRYGDLRYDIYTCFNKHTKLNEFHLFVNYSNDIFDVINDIRVLKPSYHLIDKEMIAKSGQDVEKHLNDVEVIKKYLYGE